MAGGMKTDKKREFRGCEISHNLEVNRESGCPFNDKRAGHATSSSNIAIASQKRVVSTVLRTGAIEKAIEKKSHRKYSFPMTVFKRRDRFSKTNVFESGYNADRLRPRLDG